MNITQEDINLIEKFIEIKNRGYYADGKQVTEVYNRVLGKNVNITNCGSCLRGRVQELENALNYFKELCKKQEIVSEPLKDDKVDNIAPDENKEVVEPKRRVGRPPKKS